MRKHTPAVAALFGLESMEGLERRPEEHALFYLFKLDGLLPDGQQLAIEVSRGALRVSWENFHAITAEIHLDELELRLVLALVLSYPYAVAGYQLFALSGCLGIVQAREELASARREKGDEQAMQPVDAHLATCNLKLKPLGLAITALNQEEYQLTSVQEPPGACGAHQLT